MSFFSPLPSSSLFFSSFLSLYFCLCFFTFHLVDLNAKKTPLLITIYYISERRLLYCSVCVKVYLSSLSFFRINPLHLLRNVFYVDVTCSYFFSVVQIQKLLYYITSLEMRKDRWSRQMISCFEMDLMWRGKRCECKQKKKIKESQTKC